MNSSSVARHTICYPQDRRPFRGLFFGDSPFSFDTPLLLIQLSLCALVAAVIQFLLTPLGQSVFISQILAGVILGSSFLGSKPEFRNLFFPVSSFYIVDTFAYFGVMLFLFIIGVKTDLSLVKKTGRKAVTIGICAFSMPFCLNIMAGQLLTISTPMEPRLHRSIIWIASFQATSSFHVIVCLLADLKLRNSALGRLAISSSMISGICSWIWVTILFTGKQSVHMKMQHSFPIVLLAIGIMVSFSIFIFRPIVLWMIRHTTNAKSLKESYVCAIFVIVLGSAMFGELLGQHFLFGPIILGMVIPDGPPLGSALVHKLEFFISSIIMPIYFVVSGASIDFSTISLRNFAIIELLALFALVLKIAGVMLSSVHCKMPVIDALYLGLIMSNQGIIEVIVLGQAHATGLIDKQSYSIMVISIVFFTGILSPIVKFSYKPFKKYTASEGLTIQHADPNAELRLLACMHYQEQTPSILNLLEASYPHPQSPIYYYVIHFVELAGRSAPVVVAHHPRMRDLSCLNESDHIINALRFFEHGHRGKVAVFPFTAISPYASMHDDACSLAAEMRVSLVILLFHKHPMIHVSEGEASAIRAVNHNIMKKSPCSVGILIDRGIMNCTASILSHTNVYRIGIIFLGGPDDREALAYARRMSKNPNVSLTLVRFVDSDMQSAYSGDMEQDLNMVNEYREVDMMNERCLYQEESAKDSMGVVSVIRRMTIFFDLILVGRRHDNDSPLLAGVSDWNEFPELGCLGDMLVSLDSDSKASVLVVQQAITRESKLDNPEYIRENSSDVLDMQSNDARVWPAPRQLP
ncbi:putative K+/H+-antiporter [Handroanthus impetiginosus]|uniref:Putative K+/H+-antiporter n=1 Tax=Handroanthus impetiginosus TaxID=429701 RepID=A0A2G9HPT8_9LAMI|nr:putative K+/H+-antiporter [Handroanthus impetiginosus]